MGGTGLPELGRRVRARAARRDITLDGLLRIALAAIAIYPKAREVASDGVGIVGALVDVVDESREHAGPRLVGGKAVAVDILGVDPGGNRRISAESDRMPVLGTQTAVLRPPEIGRASCRERVCQYV